MSEHFSNDAIPVRRPHFHAKAGALYFLLSRRSHASLEDAEQRVWDAIDGKSCVAELRKRFATVDSVLERFVGLGICEIPPARFPSNRRRILVIEPHMDDAALSVGGTMWLRRNECEFIVTTLAGISNFTSYYMMGREFFDIAEVTALRKAESSLFLRQVGGRHEALELLEAPLRYKHARWTLDWFRQNREGVSAFLQRWPASLELEQWESVISRLLATIEVEEIWMPLGIGRHVDHQLTRDACLTILATKPELIGGRKLRFFEDVPYNGDWPHHSEHLLEVLRSAGAQFELERVDISGALDKKLQLLSVFGSQFKMAAMGPRVIKSARLSAANSFEYGEVLYELLTPPSRKVEPLACYVERERAAAMARTLGPWLRRQRGASLVTLVVPTAFGRWTEDMQLLLDVFPRARVQVLVDRSRLAETEALSSNRIVIKPVENGRWSWYAAAGRLLLSRPNPLVLVASPGREHHARWLSAGCFGSDPIVAPTLSDFMLGLRLASATGSKASIVSGHQPEGNLETAARLPLNAGPG